MHAAVRRRADLRRRFAAVTALSVVLLWCLPATAWAEPSVTLTAPAEGLVRERTELRIEVRRQDGFETLRGGVRARPAGAANWVDLTCLDGCDSDRARVYGVEVDPRSGAPFFTRTPANGRLELDVQVDYRRNLQNRSRTVAIPLVLDVPGSPVTDLTAEADADGVRLRWNRAPEPDVSGYRVVRTAADGRTTELADLGQDATDLADAAAPGDYTYQVVTLRPSGRSGTHESSATVEVSVPAPEPVPPPGNGNGNGDGNGDGNGGGDGDGGDGDADDRDRGDTDGRGDGDRGRGDRDGSSSDGPSPRDGGSSAADGSERGGSSGSSARAPRRSPRAPTIPFERRGIPSLSTSEGFSGELDYGAEVPEAAGEGRSEDDPPDDEVVLANPGRGGGGTVLERLTDPDRVAIPIAGGLLLTAVGLHLWRWLRIPLS